MKAMIFIDYQNFQINMQEYYQNRIHQDKPRVQLPKLVEKIISMVDFSHVELVKTYLFASKPDDRLLELQHYNKFYDWLSGMKNKKHFEVIEGTQAIRQTNNDVPIDVHNQSTFYTVEKGTDVNIAVNMISKAYTNAYDIAILVSGDTDYLPVVQQLNNIGKIVVFVTLPHQNLSKYKGMYDQHIKLNNAVLQDCKAENHT